MYTDSEMRTTLQKVILILLAVMTVVFGVLTGILRTQKRVQFDEMMMTIAQEGEKAVYTGKMDGRTVTVRCYEEDGAKVVDFTVDNHIHHVGKVEYPQGTIHTEHGQDIPRLIVTRDGTELFSGGYVPGITDSLGRYYNANGTIQPFISIKVSSSNDGWSGYEFTAANILFFAEGPGFTVRGSWQGYFAALLVAVITAVDTAFPYALFYWRHRFSVRDPEPTEFYLTSQKAGSVALTMVTLGLYIAALLTKVPI